MCAKLLQSCPTLCNSIDCNPPGFSVHGILQARILEWVAMSSSRRSSWPRDWICNSCVSCISRQLLYHWGFPRGSEVKASACNSGDLSSIPGWGRSPGKGNGTPLQYSCLENPMEGGAWWVAVHGVTKSRTQLSDFTFTLTGEIEDGWVFTSASAFSLLGFWLNIWWKPDRYVAGKGRLSRTLWKGLKNPGSSGTTVLDMFLRWKS